MVVLVTNAFGCETTRRHSRDDTRARDHSMFMMMKARVTAAVDPEADHPRIWTGTPSVRGKNTRVGPANPRPRARIAQSGAQNALSCATAHGDPDARADRYSRFDSPGHARVHAWV
jgi:hypothetical protein